ncbi:MAG: tetratricopeptide repeat protein [Balneola sp.]
MMFFVLLQFYGEVSAQHTTDFEQIKESLPGLEGKERIIALHKLTNQERFNDLDQAEIYGNEALNLSQKIKSDSLKYESLFHLGGIKLLQADYPSALEYLKSAYLGFREMGVGSREASSGIRLAALYSETAQFNESLEIYFRVLEYGKETNNVSIQIHVLTRIGVMYQELKNYESARRYLKEAVLIAKENDSWRNGSLSLTELANFEKVFGDRDSAAVYYQDAIDWLKSKNSLHSIPSLLSSIGDIYKDQEKLEEALKAKKQAVLLADSLNISVFGITGLIELAVIQRMMGDFGSSVKSLEEAESRIEMTSIINNSRFNGFNLLAENYYFLEDYKKAIEFASKSLELSLENNAWSRAEQALGLLIKANTRLNLLEEVIESQKQLLAIRDSIINEDRLKIIQEYDARYNLSMKEQEIAILEIANEKKSFTQKALILGVVLVLIISGLIVRGQFLRIQRRDAKLENQELKRKKLEQELEFKSKQLVTQSLNVIQKKELIMEMKEKVESFQERGNIRELSKLSNLIDYSFTLESDWNEFKMRFEEVNSDFYKILKENFNDLTPNEMKLSALIKLNLSIKEIAVILGISSDGVKKARYRLRKKLNLSREENLTNFMLHIEKQATQFS